MLKQKLWQQSVALCSVCTAILLPLKADAFDFKEGDIYYNIIEEPIVYDEYYTEPGRVSVTFDETLHGKGEPSYSGAVNIPVSVTHNGSEYVIQELGDEAFRWAKDVTEINVNENNLIARIGDYAFAGCGAVPDRFMYWQQLYEVGNSAFRGSLVTEVNLGGNGEASLGEYLFASCPRLSKVDYLAKTAPHMFDGCTALSEVWIGSVYVDIAAYCFSDCVNLEDISEMADVGERAFENCKKLRKVELSTYCTYVGKEAFKNCEVLNELTLDGSQINYSQEPVWVDKNAFSGCTALETVKIGRPIRISDDNGDAVLFSSSPVKNLELSDAALDISLGGRNFPSLETIFCNTLLPPATTGFTSAQYSGVTVIVPEISLVKYRTDDTWSQFYKLETYTPDDYYGQIYEDGGLYYFIMRETAILTEDPFTIGRENKAYKGDIIIPEKITFNGNEHTVLEINQYAFYDCVDVKSIKIPRSILNIGKYAFYNTGITSIDLSSCSEALNNKPASLCGSCEKLEKVLLPEEGLTEIPGGMFSGCTSLKSISLPESIERIGNSAFSGSGLQRLPSLPNIRFIGESAFAGTNLTELVLNQTNQRRADLEIEAFAFNSCKLTDVNLDTYNVSFSGRYIFSGNPLERMVLDDASVEFPPLAENCHLKELDVKTQLHLGYGYSEEPAGIVDRVDHIIVRDSYDYSWLNGSLDPKMVTSHSNWPPKIGDFTDEQYATVKVNVPAESFNEYKESASWKKFLNMTDLSEIKADGYKIMVNGNDVTVTSPGNSIRIYDLKGNLTGTATDILKWRASASGVYIIKAGAETLKIII